MSTPRPDFLIKVADSWFGTTEGVSIENNHCPSYLIPLRVLSQKNMLTETAFQKKPSPVEGKN